MSIDPNVKGAISDFLINRICQIPLMFLQGVQSKITLTAIRSTIDFPPVGNQVILIKFGEGNSFGRCLLCTVVNCSYILGTLDKIADNFDKNMCVRKYTPHLVLLRLAAQKVKI